VPPETPVLTPDELARLGQELPSDRQIYFNLFVNNLGASDISTTLMIDTKPVAVIRMSFTTAKTFALMLNHLVLDLERMTGNTIMIAPDIAQKVELAQRQEAAKT
jgi:uncharacterized protein with von Willebrand factor type A (vWA) domain